ncbi:hypothetical protein BG004_000949 [Podila humilis]|nr:hypothetical protein BG004_000949 [Podila humilis]
MKGSGGDDVLPEGIENDLGEGRTVARVEDAGSEKDNAGDADAEYDENDDDEVGMSGQDDVDAVLNVLVLGTGLGIGVEEEDSIVKRPRVTVVVVAGGVSEADSVDAPARDAGGDTCAVDSGRPLDGSVEAVEGDFEEAE